MTTEEYKKISAPSEETEQIHLMTWCKWAESKYPCLAAIYHIPNEGKRSAVTGGRLKEMGLKAGVPDICLPVPRGAYSGLYIELKKIGGKPTSEQIAWLRLLEHYGHAVAICEGAEAAETVITAYCERDIDTLQKLCLNSDRGDFERIKPKTNKASKPRIGKSLRTFGMILLIQLIISAIDIVSYGTVTGRSCVPAAICSICAITEVCTELLHGDEYGIG